MLLCILLSWLHNAHLGNSLDNYSSAATRTIFGSRFAVVQNVMTRISAEVQQSEESAKAAPFDALSSQMKQSSEEAVNETRKFSEQADRAHQSASRMGTLAILSIEIAFVLLLIFAMKNASLL
jgi:hypothetical protein